MLDPCTPFPTLMPARLSRNAIRVATLVLSLVFLHSFVYAQDEPATGSDRAAAEAFFETKIRPILVERCLECHGAQKQKANLRLDTAQALEAGGDSGAVVVAGKPDESFLIQVVRYSADLKMPPKSKLPDAEIALLAEWVRRGAIWPTTESSDRSTPSGPKQSATVTDEDRKFWAFSPLSTAAPPAVQNVGWVSDQIDRFILSKLEQANHTPAPAADRRTLIRRATFDLHGVPPTPQEIAAFLADDSPDAFAHVVDRLLASPRYGERYGRHWLDIVRYADSNGLDENLAYANAFRYRDYVIRSFNQDKPYDTLIHEQIAGDLLPATDDVAVRFDRTIATGFLSLGAKMLAEDDPVKMQMDIIDEQVDTLGRAFLGLTLGCARCHDHKFDPIPQADYYALAGILKSTKTMENFSVVAKWQEVPLAAPDVIVQRTEKLAMIQQIRTGATQQTKLETDQVLRSARRRLGDLLLAAEEQSRFDSALANLPVRGPKPGEKPPVDSLFFEAETFARGNVAVFNDGYGAGIGVLVNKGETPNFVEYDLQIPQAGVYQIEVRYAAADGRPNILSVGGKQLRKDAAGKVTGSWYPDTQTWFIEAVAHFEAGPTVLRFENPGPFPHIDKFLITPAIDKTGKSLSAPNVAPEKSSPLVAAFSPGVMGWLKKSRDQADSPFALWLDSTARESDGDSLALPNKEALTPLAQLLLAEPVPQNLVQLAARYQQLGIEAISRWEELQSRPETKSIASLSDAGLELLRQQLVDPAGPLAPPQSIESLFPPTVRQEIIAQRDEAQKLEQMLPKFPETMAVSDSAPENLRIHLRGSHLNLGTEVPRGFPQVFSHSKTNSVSSTTSGRRELAHWLTAPENSLTSRVIVNRVWQWHFGEGLVRSPDNFGRLGELPTHPELLDYLSRELMADGWSLKSLHRRILLSSTWQMSTRFNEQAAEADPENRLWWRFQRRRLEVEALRDSIFAVAGTLDPNMGGSLLPTPNRNYVTSTANVNPVIYDPPRRSVYLPVVRSALYDVFQAFDFADPSVQSGKRESTTVAPQALFLMNSELVDRQTLRLATRLLEQPQPNDSERVEQLYERTLGRPPRTLETQRALDFIAKYTAAIQAEAREPKAPELLRKQAWQSLCRAVLATNEFLYVE